MVYGSVKLQSMVFNTNTHGEKVRAVTGSNVGSTVESGE